MTLLGEAGLRAAVASGGQVVVVGSHESPTTAAVPRVADLRPVEVASDGARTVLRLG